MKALFAAVCSFTLLGSNLAAAAPAESGSLSIVIEGRLSRLPLSEPCRDRRLIWVLASYRVEKVLRGQGLKVGDEVVVAHACPRRARGFSPKAKGDAGRLLAGQRHLLELGAFTPKKKATVVDPFPADRRRFRALRADPLKARPHIVVTAHGPGLQHRLGFTGLRVAIGSSSRSDIWLKPPVAPLHAELVVENDKLRVRPLGEDSRVLIDGSPIGKRGGLITYRSRISVGPYTLSASLLSGEAP